MHATSVWLVLAYATSPDDPGVHGISTQLPPELHHHRLDGEVTYATCSTSALVQAGNPDGVFAWSEIRSTPSDACGGDCVELLPVQATTMADSTRTNDTAASERLDRESTMT
jgi:hypothetical protein